MTTTAKASSTSGWEFDLLIIGGGINGAGIAREAATRGLKVCLLEKETFGSGTSSKSSMLAHGGIRYLEQFEFKLVYEALNNREALLKEFPDLVQPIEFVYPLYPWTAARRTMRVGMWLYDLLSRKKSLPKRRYLRKKPLLERVPGLSPDGLVGAGVYWDGQFVDVPALIRRVAEKAAVVGADCREGIEVTGLLMDGNRCVGVTTPDFDVSAKVTINAAGPWVDVVLGNRREGPPLIRGTKGIHLVVPRFVEVALIVRAKDGRTFFVIPWKDHCLIGTTDTDEPIDARYSEATPVDISYLQESVLQYFPGAPVHDIRWCYAGVRPLVNQEGLTESSVTRRHVLDDTIPGLISIQGGKLTTYPSLARDAVAAVAKEIR